MPRLRYRLRGIARWRLWGVLLCGVGNVLLYERGSDLFIGHGAAFLMCLIALPILAGFVTPQKPIFTAAVLAIGSVPPLNDMPPMSIVMWPFYELGNGRFFTWLVHLPFALAFAALAGGMMFFAYFLPVLFGWGLKRTVVKRSS